MNTHDFQYIYKIQDWIDQMKLNNIAMAFNPIYYENYNKINQHIQGISLYYTWLYVKQNKINCRRCDCNMSKKICFSSKCILYVLQNILENTNETIEWNTFLHNAKKDISTLSGTYISPYIFWKFVCKNTTKMEVLEKNFSNINWEALSENPFALSLLKKNYDKIVWKNLSSNPNAIELLRTNPTQIDWSNLSSNENAILLLEENLSKINWYNLSSNPNAFSILEKNKDKINWEGLCKNPNSTIITFLKENQEKINWMNLSFNPAIFVYDYDKMKANFYNSFGKELIEWIWKPSNMHRWGKMEWDIYDIMEDL